MPPWQETLSYAAVADFRGGVMSRRGLIDIRVWVVDEAQIRNYWLFCSLWCLVLDGCSLVSIGLAVSRTEAPLISLPFLRLKKGDVQMVIHCRGEGTGSHQAASLLLPLSTSTQTHRFDRSKSKFASLSLCPIPNRVHQSKGFRHAIKVYI